jgi:KTSC domain
MQLVPVYSSSLAALGYDADSQGLHIRFRNGQTYKYLSVPQSTFEALMRAPSKGTFFSDNIKERFTFVRL